MTILKIAPQVMGPCEVLFNQGHKQCAYDNDIC